MPELRYQNFNVPCSRPKHITAKKQYYNNERVRHSTQSACITRHVSFGFIRAMVFQNQNIISKSFKVMRSYMFHYDGTIII